MKVSTHTHMNIYIKMHKRKALEHKEISENHEPTIEYSSYNHRIIKIIKNRKDKRGGSKYLKRDERIGHVHIQKRHPINQ